MVRMRAVCLRDAVVFERVKGEIGREKRQRTRQRRVYAKFKTRFVCRKPQPELVICKRNRFLEIYRSNEIEYVYKPKNAPDRFTFDRSLNELRRGYRCQCWVLRAMDSEALDDL